MHRHPTDHTRSESNARLREFARQEREQRPHPASLALHARPKNRADDNRKTVEFVRIQKGHLA